MHNYNPLAPNDFARVDYIDPRTVVPRQTDIYQIQNVSLVKLADNSQVIRLEGRGLPLSYVTVFIYSMPIISIAKVNSAGIWRLDIDFSLSNGQHSAYAALISSNGDLAGRCEQLVL